MFVYWSNYPLFNKNRTYYSVGMGCKLLGFLCEINNKSYTKVYHPYFYIVNRPDESSHGLVKKRNQFPSNITNDCLKVPSTNSPKINPIITGTTEKP